MIITPDLTKTENEVVVTDINAVTSTGDIAPLPKISVDNMFMKYGNKMLSVLRALASNKRFFYSYRISVLKIKDPSDSDIVVHFIKNKDGSVEIFDTFRKLGISMTELSVGLSADGKKLYVPNIILRALSKFPTSVQQELVMYLVSIAHMFTGLTTEIPELHSTYGGHLEARITDWYKYLYSFKDVENITVSEIPTEDLKCIRYYYNKYSTPSKNLIGYPDNSAVITSCEGVRNLVLSREIDTSTFWIYNPEKNCVYTNESISYMNMDYGTYSAGIVQAIGKTIDVLYTPKLAFDSKKTYEVSTTIEEDCYECDKIFQKIVNHYNSNMGIVKSKLDLLIPKYVASGGIVDKEAMMEQYKDDERAQQLYAQAQDYYDTFDLKSLTNSVKGFSNGDIYAMMFVGDSGTGKSTAAKVIPYRCGIPYAAISFCVNIEESDLVGTMIPNPEKAKAEDPEFIWKDGIITEAVRNGYTVVLEEINFARPGVLGKLNSLLDENRQIDLPTGEILKAHKNFRMIATCNIAYEGTNRFNKALINRFEIIHKFEDLDKMETFKTIKSRIKGVDDVKLNKIYTVYELLKKYSKEQGLELVVSIRQLFNVFRQGKYYQNAYDAIQDIIVNGAFIELPEYKDRFTEVLKDMKKDLMFKI